MDSELSGISRDVPSQVLDGQALKQLVEAGLTWLRTNQQTVNSLNVFPVPDGDTGTNMVLTMQAAFAEIATSSERNAGKIAHAVAHGALMGARGNSGVILSQLWRGFARVLDNLEYLDGMNIAHAFAVARDTAYKGVVRPVEGTILTVAKDVAAAAEQAVSEMEDPAAFLEHIVAAAGASVQRTPELLPVLKEAGVVDSGGKGLFYLLEGMSRYMQGQPLDVAEATIQPLAAVKIGEALEIVEPGQDFEVVVDFRPHVALDLAKFYRDLEEMGTSIQVGEGDGIYRMHIHVPTDNRYAPIDYTMSLGVVTKVAIENLIAQMDTASMASAAEKIDFMQVEPGQVAVVAVTPGIGIARIFASLGAAAIVEGGQTMNPSTQEIIRAFNDLPTDKIIILPNNKNIVLAAKTAAELTDKKVAVIPSRTVPQGISAIFHLSPDGDFDEQVSDMTRAIGNVLSGEITTATRSVEIDGIQVQEGQTIALLNGKLVLAASSVEEACLSLLEKANADDYEKITLFYGNNISLQEVEQIVEKIRSAYPDTLLKQDRVELQYGGQPHYQFIISIE